MSEKKSGIVDLVVWSLVGLAFLALGAWGIVNFIHPRIGCDTTPPTVVTGDVYGGSAEKYTIGGCDLTGIVANPNFYHISINRSREYRDLDMGWSVSVNYKVGYDSISATRYSNSLSKACKELTGQDGGK